MEKKRRNDFIIKNFIQIFVGVVFLVTLLFVIGMDQICQLEAEYIRTKYYRKCVNVLPEHL